MEHLLKYKTRNDSNPKGKPRVYFACHPDDYETTFERISNQILMKQNCVIYYSESNQGLKEDELKDAILQMQLVVIPITAKFLFEDNQAYEFIFKTAKSNNIPILPIMQEKNIETIFNEKCGDIQYLDEFTLDPTAISYDKKLENFLNSVLISDELAEKIRNAFDAYIFLSYRKKDRKYAQELMKLIHKNDFCRDIAIWYDEFLVPGESFNDAIADALKKSKLFALVVTPNLINEENYVMTTEYPMARERKMHILPAESVETDKEELKAKFADIPDCTDAHNEKMLSDSMLQAIKALAIKSNDSSPEHNFFIGLAYLSGIDVEVDFQRAVSLIKSSAEAGLIEAKEKLVAMYENGLGVKRDYFEVIKWQVEVCEYYYEMYYSEPSQENLENVINANYRTAFAFINVQMYDEAKDAFKTVLDQSEELKEYDASAAEQHRINALNGLHKNSIRNGEYAEATKYIAEVLDVLEENTEIDTMQKAIYYSNAGLSSYFEQNIDQANKYYNISLSLFQKVDDKSTDYLVAISRLYMNMGTTMYAIKDYDTAIRNYEESMKYSEEANELSANKYIEDIFECYCSITRIYIQQEEVETGDKVLHKLFNIIYKKHKDEKQVTWIPFKAKLQNLIGMLHWKKENYPLAEKHYNKAATYYEKYDFMENNPYLIEIAMVYNNLGVLYSSNDDYDKAVESYKKASSKFLSKNNTEIKNREYYALMELNIATCLFKNKKYEEAEKYVFSAYELYKTMYKEGNSQFACELKLTAKQALEICLKQKKIIKGLKTYYKALLMIK